MMNKLKLVISQERIEARKRKDWIREQVSLMSDSYLAMLDKNNIKILGLGL